MDETGNEIGVIRQEGQSKARKLLRLVGSIDQFLTHRLSMYDEWARRFWISFVQPSSSRCPRGRPHHEAMDRHPAGRLHDGRSVSPSRRNRGPTDLRLFMFASAAGIDTALKQDDTSGFGFGGIDLDI